MPAGSTYSTIATAQGTGSSGTVTFSSIPSTYTDLVLVSNLEPSASANLIYQYNGNSSSIYSDTTMYGDGTSKGSYRRSSQTLHYISYFPSSGQRLTVISHFQSYSNTNIFKSILTRASNASFELNEVVGLWSSTSAINSISIFLNNSANFTSSSTFTLYGIAAA